MSELAASRTLRDKILVRYIALESEVQRIASMEQWLPVCLEGAPYARIPGVVISDIESAVEYIGELRLKRFGYHMTNNEIGCFLAHRECWKNCVQADKPMMIFEGDVAPERGSYTSLLTNALVNRTEFFDIVRLHGVFERNEVLNRKVLSLPGPYNLVQSLGDVMGSAAYFLKPSAAFALLKASSRFFVPVDVFLGSTWLHRQRFRAVKPYPFLTYDFPSTIGEDRRRPKQNLVDRLRIEAARMSDDLRRLAYLPTHFFR
mgnify:CR=1 FL=1